MRDGRRPPRGARRLAFFSPLPDPAWLRRQAVILAATHAKEAPWDVAACSRASEEPAKGLPKAGTGVALQAPAAAGWSAARPSREASMVRSNFPRFPFSLFDELARDGLFPERRA